MGFGIATQTGISAAIQSIPSMMSNRGLRNGYGATFAANFTDGTNTLDPRITFSRASNATVTNSSGNIVNAPMNLLTFSEQFDNAAWTKTRSSITANTTAAPDGTTTADKLVEDTTASSTHFTRQTYTGSLITLTFSVYAKASERTKVNLQISNIFNDAVAATFDLSTGTVSAATSSNIDYTNPSAAILSVGNGWYRCSITATKGNVNTTNGCSVDLNNGSTTIYTGDGTSGAFIWGAQLELRSSAGTYNPTTVKNLVGFSEAFDNAAWTKTNSFVQTNLQIRSEDFTTATTWQPIGGTATGDTTISPRSSTDADTFTEDTANTNHGFSELTTSITSGVTYTASVYAKAGTASVIQILGRASPFGSNIFANFNLATGTVGSIGSSTTASIQNVGNGWYRCVMTGTATGTATGSIAIVLTNGDANAARFPSYTGTGKTVFIWGAQVVQGSVAGDYQQTTSAALPVQYAAPNGTMTADKLVENTATSSHTINLASAVTITANVTNTVSVYLKAAERTRARLIFANSAYSVSARVDVNLSSGTIGSPAALAGSPTNLNASIVSVGNGWYRVSLTALLDAVSTSANVQVNINDDSGNQSYTGNGTSGIFIWGAQLSDAASVTPYVNTPIAAPTSAAYYGPRFDYDPVTLQPRGLLIEEQRTNLLTYSEQFNNAAWTLARATVSADATTSPDGTVDADKLIEDTSATTTHLIRPTSLSVTSGIVYTFSVFAKAAERTQIQLAFGTESSAFASTSATFTLTGNGSFTADTGTPNPTITPVGNGWYRCTATATATATTSGAFIRIFLASNGTVTYTGNGTSGVFLWGAQVEAGAFATSYIPTVASQVTRSADTAIVQGSNFSGWYNQNEGTIFSNAGFANAPFAGGNRFAGAVAINDATANNYIGLTYTVLPGSSLRYAVGDIFAGGVGQTSFAYDNILENTAYKTALAYKLNDSNFGYSGKVATTDTSVTIPTVTQMQLGLGRGGANLNGHIRSITYYPTRLQNSQLQAITQ